MTAFLTVKEASQLTGKSPSSIRRIIYPIVHDDAHPDRTQVHPSVAEALELRMKGENFPWQLSDELLRRELPEEVASDKAGTPSSARAGGTAEGELLAMLRRELDIKNQQITQQSELIVKQMEVIDGLGERIREGNILIGSLQQRLALTDGRQPNTPEPTPATRPPSTLPKQGSTMPPKSTKPKPGFLSRLFR